MSDDLDFLRKKRLKELQDAAQMKQQETEQDRQRAAAQQEYEIQKQNILRQILTDPARRRLSNIKLVKPQMAEVIENQLIQIAQTGRLQNSQISEEQLLQMLKKIQLSKRDPTIKFKRR